MAKGRAAWGARCGDHGGRNNNGYPCGLGAIPGTDRCWRHCGETPLIARAKGQIVVEIRKWGLDAADPNIDPGDTLLRLVSQSYARAELYSHLLAQAYEAATRLHTLLGSSGAALEDMDPDDLAGLDHPLPYGEQNEVELQRVRADLKRIFNTGGVAALIGHTYNATKDGDVYAVGEAIRGLTLLEASERDRCANFSTKAIAAGLAERQVRVAEQLAATLVQAVYAMLGELGLSRDDPHVRAVVAAKLRELAGGDGVAYGVGVIEGMTVDEREAPDG